MANPLRSVSVKWDQREFNRTLRRYREFSKRDPDTIVNTKAFYILRRATIETPKATKAKIKSDLMTTGRAGAPIAALIVNARRKAEGLPGLSGDKMKKAMAALIRMRRIATLKSGWLWAIKDIEPFAEKRGAPRVDRSAKAVGQRKGFGFPSKNSFWKAKAVFINRGGAAWDTRDTGSKIASAALQRAFDFEVQSMKAYIERKLRETADRAGIKHN